MGCGDGKLLFNFAIYGGDMNRLDLIINALENSEPINKESSIPFDKHLKALAAARELKALAQPEQEPFKPDWVSYRQGVADGAAQPEQLLPPVDIGVDVTPEGTHVVAFYNRHDAVQEMFYSRFHPLDKPKQEPVAWAVLRDDGRVKMLSHQQGVEVDLKWTPLYTKERT